MPVTVAQVVGANLARIRESSGFTLDDVALHARRYRLRWNTARMSRIERGEGSIGLETVLMLSVILADLTGKLVSVSDLLESGESVALAPRATLRPGVAQTLTCGSGDVAADGLIEEEEAIFADQMQNWDEIKDALGRLISRKAEPALFLSALMEMTLSDDRNARKLGLTSAEFSAWSVRLWGHLMSKETEKRAPEGATAQKKGRITRELMAEMREAVERDNGHD